MADQPFDKGKPPRWFFRQSGVIPWRWRDGRVEVLLVTNRKGTRWVIPKGVVEPGLSPSESARQEAWEEAGLRGVLSSESIGSYTYCKWGGTCSVEVFPMQVTEIGESWPEQELRNREWLTPAVAAERVREPDLQSMIVELCRLLQHNASDTQGISGS